MGVDVELSCRCGEVRGRLRDAAPNAVNRVVCYCDDCQAFLHHLGRADLLDAQGGTDIVQVAPALFRFERGGDRLAGLRLTRKGLNRWYASCCKTPVGNTFRPWLPFVGVPRRVFQGGEADHDAVFGKPRSAIYGQFAVGAPPQGSTKPDVRMMAHFLRLTLGWKLTRKSFPHPFFDRATRAPSRELVTLSRTERDALRPLCGPRRD
jgi:hypothetical protein